MQVVERQELEKAADKQTAASKARSFTTEAQKIWAEPDLEKKRFLLRTTMVAAFTYRRKEHLFYAKVERCTSTKQIDTLAKEIMLWGEGLSVLKW